MTPPPASLPAPAGKPATPDQANAVVSRLANAADVDQIAADILQAHGTHSLALIGLLTDRLLRIVRLEKERQNFGALLDALLGKSSLNDARLPTTITANRVGAVLIAAFSSLVVERLYEDSPKLWKCWCQIVASGKSSGIFEFSFHDEAFRTALLNCTSSNSTLVDVRVIQALLLDVYTSINACPLEKRVMSDNNRFRRFRPLSVLLSLLADGAPSLQGVSLTKLFATAKLLDQDLELLVFATLVDSTKTDKCELLFSQIRTSPKLSESSTSAKILSAVLSAEPLLHTSLLELYTPLLNVTVDTTERGANETNLVGEVMIFAENMPLPFRSPGSNLCARVLQLLKANQVVSIETVDRLQRYAEVTLGPSKAQELFGQSKQPYYSQQSGPARSLK